MLEEIEKAIPREVGPTEKRLPLGRERRGHRPAATAGQRLDRGHVDAVHVGPLLAIHLDGDEVLVEIPRDFEILERLALHHVAPVTGRIAHAEQHRLVLPRGARERLVAPRVPAHGIVRVLEQIGARL